MKPEEVQAGVRVIVNDLIVQAAGNGEVYAGHAGEIIEHDDPRRKADRPHLSWDARPGPGNYWVLLDAAANDFLTWKFDLKFLDLEITEQEIQEAVQSIMNARPKEANP